jgi:uncharacterized tellurite resistance protein B-like protein
MQFSPTLFVQVDAERIVVEADTPVELLAALDELRVKRSEYRTLAEQTYAIYRDLRAAPDVNPRALSQELDKDMAPIEAAGLLIARAIGEVERMLAEVVRDRPEPHKEAKPAQLPSVHALDQTQALPPCSDPQEDGWGDTYADPYGPGSRALAAEVRIAYRGSKEQTTHRSVSVQRYARTGENSGVMLAFCHARGGRRTFRFSRIQHAADLAEARRIDNLGDWLDERYHGTTAGRCESFLEVHGAAVEALFLVAKADGAFRQPEKALLSAFCAEHGLSGQEERKLLVDWVAAWLPPSRVAYGKALRSIAMEDEAYRASVLKAAKAMVASDSQQRDSEAAALARMARELGVK